MTLVQQETKKLASIILIVTSYMYSELQSTLALRTPRYNTDKTQPPGERYRGWTENDSAFTELRTLSWYQHNNCIVFTLDKADTLNFSYIYVRYVIIFASISWYRTLLEPFPSRL